MPWHYFVCTYLINLSFQNGKKYKNNIYSKFSFETQMLSCGVTQDIRFFDQQLLGQPQGSFSQAPYQDIPQKFGCAKKVKGEC